MCINSYFFEQTYSGAAHYFSFALFVLFNYFFVFISNFVIIIIRGTSFFKSSTTTTWTVIHSSKASDETLFRTRLLYYFFGFSLFFLLFCAGPFNCAKVKSLMSLASHYFFLFSNENSVQNARIRWKRRIYTLGLLYFVLFRYWYIVRLDLIDQVYNYIYYILVVKKWLSIHATS